MQPLTLFICAENMPGAKIKEAHHLIENIILSLQCGQSIQINILYLEQPTQIQSYTNQQNPIYLWCHMIE